MLNDKALPAGHPADRSRPGAWARLRRAPWLAGLEPYLYLMPAFLAIGVWVYWPLLSTLSLSLYQWNLLPSSPKTFVGLENFYRVVTLPEMRQALLNTALYIGGLLPLSVLLPLAIAIVVADITGRLRNIYRVIIFAPVLIAPVVVAVIWRWILNPVQGVLNLTLHGLFGIDPINWFNDPRTAIWAIIGITGWKLLGFSVLIFSAGLTNISRELLDAAAIDGATRWQIVRRVTLPLLSPTIMFMILLTVLLSAQWTFPLINVLTAGGPFDATTNVYYVLWQFGFRSFNIGWSTAAAMLFFAGFAVLAWIFLRLTDRYSFYDH